MVEKPLDPVFVITRDGDLLLFKRIRDAEGYIEATDVVDGEYVDLFDLHGEVLTVEVAVEGSREPGPVTIQRTGRHDRVRLIRSLRTVAERNGYDGADPDPKAVANEVFANEWKHRWPRWPGWLDRRLHGDGPPSL